jgi:hypothetical protein
VIHDLATARAVVVSRSLRSRPRVLDAVRRAFELRYRAGGVSIYTRR